MLKCNFALLNDPKALEYLHKKRGLTKETVSMCGLGIDKTKKLWTIPTFAYDIKDCFVTGFEYRPANLSKKGLHREKGTPNSMAMINCYTLQTESLIIVEGYFDGYALLQHLSGMKQSQYYHIVTPSNGINAILKYMETISFSTYKKVYLYIDNDEVSRAKALEIKEKYPFIETIKMTCSCKDFNEHLLKCLSVQ